MGDKPALCTRPKRNRHTRNHVSTRTYRQTQARIGGRARLLLAGYRGGQGPFRMLLVIKICYLQAGVELSCPERSVEMFIMLRGSSILDDTYSPVL